MFFMDKNWRLAFVIIVLAGLSGALIAQGPPSPPSGSRGKPTVRRIGPGSARAVSSRASRTTPSPAAAPANTGSKAIDASEVRDLQLSYKGAPLDIVLDDYAQNTGKTLLRAPGLPNPMFTLRSQGKLTKEEYLKAIESVLSMNGIGLVETGERFVRVVPIAEVVNESGAIYDKTEDGVVPEISGKLMNQMILLKHIDIAEATKAIQPLIHKYGKIIPFERINAIMVVDSPGNVNRVLQVLRTIDQPIDAREEPRIIQIHYAKATDIKQKLQEIIAEAQKDQKKSTVAAVKRRGSPGFVRSSPTGVMRARTIRHTTAPQIAAILEQAERGIIRGNVKIVADERTNKLIIITRPENMVFFEKIVAVLDVETSPEVEVKVVRLEFAEAKKVESMLNDLIGANDKDAPSAPPGSDAAAGSMALRAYAERLKHASASQKKKSSVGELSKDNIKILSDERTNALILMASKADLSALMDIISSMDMMLSQVLIESVILDIKLGGNIETGVTWIQNSLTTYEKDANGNRSPVASFRGRAGGAGLTSLGDALDNAAHPLPTGGGLGYFLTLYDLNITAIIKASSSDSRTRVVSTPVLLTTDNTEAKLTSTEKIYVFEGTTYYNNNGGYAGSNSERYRQQDIGLELSVTPHINQNKVVMMEIKQKISEPGDQNGDTKNLAGQTISRDREIEASIAVRSGQTIVLGGQVREGNSRQRTKVPFLGDIPVIGRLFNSDSRTKARTEMIVFITPYVLDTPDEVSEKTKKLHDSLSSKGLWKKGLSDSTLADDVTPRRGHRKELKPNASREDFTWTTSGGKAARLPDDSYMIEKDGEDGVRSTNDAMDSDVDEFLRKQREKWDSALKEAS